MLVVLCNSIELKRMCLGGLSSPPRVDLSSKERKEKKKRKGGLLLKWAAEKKEDDATGEEEKRKKRSGYFIRIDGIKREMKIEEEDEAQSPSCHDQRR